MIPLVYLLIFHTLFSTASALIPPLNDPQWKYQWYLNPSARGYNLTLNVMEPWLNGITGSGVKVAIVDQGVHHDGGDLGGQVIQEFDNRESCSSDCMTSSGDHGSAAAGVVAMIANNNQCGVGIAPQASIVDVPIFGKLFPTNEVKGNALKSGLDVPGMDIYSNSWGTFDGGASMTEMAPEIKEAIKKGVEEGRGGKGALYVWAAGNGGINGDSCAYDAFVNSRMTVSVTGVNYQGSLLATGERCSAIMAAAPSRGTNDGYYESPVITPKDSTDCSYKFSESSAAAAMGSGVLALLLSANPNLSWRDVQHLIPLTSNPCIADDFVTNNRGLKYSHSVGFGFLNAGALVSAGQNWQNVASEPIVCTAAFYPQRQPGTRMGYIYLAVDGITCPQGATIGYLEHVTLDITAYPLVRGGMKINVTSPSMTKSITFPGRWQDLIGSPSVNLTNWQVLSYAFWGESITGNRHWKIDYSGVDSTRITRIGIEFRGLANAPSSMPTNIQPCQRPSSTLLNDYGLPAECQDWNPWGACSVSCGDGTRSRTRLCKRTNWFTESEDGSCNAGSCPVACPNTCTRETLITKGSCSNDCGTGYRQDLVDCSISGQQTIRCYRQTQCTGYNCPNIHQCPNYCYEEQNVDLGECSVGCGVGTKRDHLDCKYWDGNAYNFQTCFRDDSCQGTNCEGTATVQCPEGINPLTGWSTCSQSCGGGIQTRTVRCYKAQSTFEDQVQIQRCNQQDCEQSIIERLNCVSNIVEGEWSACSVTCGSGATQRRNVQCTNNQGLTVGTEETRECTDLPPCPNAGSSQCVRRTGETYSWSTCSTTCGPGERSRVYKCEISGGDTKYFLETEACEVAVCPTTTTGPSNCITISDLGCRSATAGCMRTLIKLCDGQQFVAVEPCEC